MSPSSAPRRHLFTKLALVLGGLLAVELGVRGWLALGSGPAGGPAAALLRTAAEVGETEPEAATGDLDAGGDRARGLHPYFGWGGPGIDERIARHGQSFRGDDGGRLDLAITGGSVAVFFIRQASEDLIERIHTAPRFQGREVRILNLSSGGLKQPQHLIRLAVALNAGWRPDAVINLDGFNELAAPIQNVVRGIEPTYPPFDQWGGLLGERSGGPEFRQGLFEVMRAQARAVELAQRFERFGLGHSALLSQLAWMRMRSLRAEYVGAQERFVSALAAENTELSGARGFEPHDEALLDECAYVWAESSRSMHALCAARSILYLHVLQPTLHDAGSKPLTAEEIAADPVPESWMQAVRAGYPRLRGAGAELAAEGVGFVDGSQVFAEVETTLYYDRCHFSAAGNRILAEFIARELIDRLP